MKDVEPRGAVHWIDHYVVGTNDLPGLGYWAIHATGLPIRPINGLTTNMRKKNTPIFCFHVVGRRILPHRRVPPAGKLSRGQRAGQRHAALRLLYPA